MKTLTPARSASWAHAGSSRQTTPVRTLVLQWRSWRRPEPSAYMTRQCRSPRSHNQPRANGDQRIQTSDQPLARTALAMRRRSRKCRQTRTTTATAAKQIRMMASIQRRSTRRSFAWPTLLAPSRGHQLGRIVGANAEEVEQATPTPRRQDTTEEAPRRLPRWPAVYGVRHETRSPAPTAPLAR
jgi:hypothetical protein